MRTPASLAVGNRTTGAPEAVVRAGLSHVGGVAGEALGGETGQAVGSFLGGATPEVAANLATRLVAKGFRGDNTADVSAAGQRLGVYPNTAALSNIPGRRFLKAIRSVPLMGAPVRTAQEEFEQALQLAHKGVADQVYGAPVTPGMGPEEVGNAILDAARQGSANVSQQARDQQQQLISGRPARPATGTQPAQPAQPGIGANTGVDARSVYYGPAGYQTRLSMDPGIYPAYKARLDNIRQAAIEAQQPAWQNFWGQLAHGEIPYQRFQEMRSNLGGTLAGFEGMSKGQKDQLYESDDRAPCATRHASVAVRR